MPCFEYGEAEAACLKKKDKKLGALMDRLGVLSREVSSDPFESLVSSVISQQISGKAAQTVAGRLMDKAGGALTPQGMAGLSQEEIQACGMSMRKAGYIRGIARAAASGQIDFAGLHRLSDGEIIRELTALSGVGVWTVEMLLLFALGRQDIVSYGDFSIRKGMMRLYGLKELTGEQFKRYRKRYSPYGSIASLYLWELAGEPEPKTSRQSR